MPSRKQSDPEPIADSSFFHYNGLPEELRDEIFEYACTPPPLPGTDPMVPVASIAAELRLACKKINNEYERIVHKETEHFNNWAKAPRCPNPYSGRLYALETHVPDNVRHIALRGQTKNMVAQLASLQLTRPLTERSPQRPFPNVKAITFVLDRPKTQAKVVTGSRIWQEQWLCEQVWGYVDVDKVIIRNIYHRHETKYRADKPGQSWHLLQEENDLEHER
jgi:hypothetical protein